MATAMYLRFEKSQFLQICLTYMYYYVNLDNGKIAYPQLAHSNALQITTL